MDYLTFSNNWNNKLQCEIFSTVRLRNDTRFYLGKVFDDVWLCDKSGKKLVEYGPHEVVLFRTCRLHEVTDYMAMIDTGYPQKEFVNIIQTMYKNRTPVINWETQELCVMLLRKTRRQAIQQALF